MNDCSLHGFAMLHLPPSPVVLVSFSGHDGWSPTPAPDPNVSCSSSVFNLFHLIPDPMGKISVMHYEVAVIIEFTSY